MSRSYALVKFKKTGNIYFGCYSGTTDIMLPFICTPEECYDKELGCYCAISTCTELGAGRSWDLYYCDVDDMDEVEIYSDYGGGFYWPGEGSESARMLKKYLDPYEECYEEMIDGQPEWVKDFWQQLELSDE